MLGNTANLMLSQVQANMDDLKINNGSFKPNLQFESLSSIFEHIASIFKV